MRRLVRNNRNARGILKALEFFSLALALTFSGCPLNVHNKPLTLKFALMSMEPIETGSFQLGMKTTGEDCEIAWPPGWGSPDATLALERALENGNGDLLLDVEIRRTLRYRVFWLLYCDEVTGTVAWVSKDKAQKRE